MMRFVDNGHTAWLRRLNILWRGEKSGGYQAAALKKRVIQGQHQRAF
jgi:hypothetical protein